jgi:hypothetical protein
LPVDGWWSTDPPVADSLSPGLPSNDSSSLVPLSAGSLSAGPLSND